LYCREDVEEENDPKIAQLRSGVVVARVTVVVVVVKMTVPKTVVVIACQTTLFNYSGGPPAGAWR
jgi:hypothetical protein